MPDFTHHSSEVALRFRRQGEWFIAGRTGNLHVLRVQAISERAVELFLLLSARLHEVVGVAIDHPRDGSSWHGAMRFLPEVRETLGRLRWPLASFGGVEIALVTSEEQLTLTTSLELVIYSREDRWRTVLEAEGLEPRTSAPAPIWNPADVGWSPAPELSAALATAVARLALEPGS